MKIRFLMLMVLAYVMLACKPVSPDTPYSIEGELTGVRDSLVIRLVRWENNFGETIAKDTILNGHFKFEGIIDDVSTDIELSVRDEEFPSMSRRVYVAPGVKVKVKGSDNYIASWKVESPLKEQHIYDEIEAPAKEDNLIHQKVLIEYYKKMGLYNPENFDRDALPILSKQFDSINKVIVDKEVQQMKKMKPSIPWFEKLSAYVRLVNNAEAYSAHKQEFIDMINAIPDDMKQDPMAMELQAFLFPPKQAKIGDDYPDTDFYDLQGNLHHISEFKGKYILLDFWSRGCGPCLQAIPQMKEMYREMGDKLVMISISLDPEKHCRTASKQHEIIWNNWNEMKGRAGLYTNYRINAIPYYVLINPAGKIQEIILGFNKNYLMEAIEL